MPDKQPVPPDLRAALACRNWIELHLHELWQAPRGLEVLGTFDVLAWADQRSAPEGAGEALAALVRVAQFDEPGIDAHLAQFDLAEPDASWLAQVGSVCVSDWQRNPTRVCSQASRRRSPRLSQAPSST